MTTIAKILVLSTAVVGALATAPGAAASPESEFCQSMSAVGITDDCAALTDLARDVCAQKARGVELATVVEQLDVATKDQNLSNFIIAGAQLYLCPETEATT